MGRVFLDYYKVVAASRQSLQTSEREHGTSLLGLFKIVAAVILSLRTWVGTWDEPSEFLSRKIQKRFYSYYKK